MHIIHQKPSTLPALKNILLSMKTDGWRDRLSLALDKAKRDHGITQEKLAELLNLYQGTISKWKTGGATPPLETFEKLATTLEVPLEWMLFGDVARLNEDERHLLEDYRDNPQANKDALRTIARSGRQLDTKTKASDGK